MSRSMFMVTSVFSKLSSPTPCWRRLVGSGMKPWPHGLKGKVVPCRGQPDLVTKLNTTMKRNSCLSSRWLQSKQSIFRHFTFKAILLQDFHQPGYTNNVDTIYHPCALVQCKPRSHKPSSFSGIALNIRGSETSGLGLQVWTATLLLQAQQNDHCNQMLHLFANWVICQPSIGGPSTLKVSSWVDLTNVILDIQNQSNCAYVPDHHMQAVLDSRNTRWFSSHTFHGLEKFQQSMASNNC